MRLQNSYNNRLLLTALVTSTIGSVNATPSAQHPPVKEVGLKQLYCDHIGIPFVVHITVGPLTIRLVAMILLACLLKTF